MADTLFILFVVKSDIHGSALRAWGDFTPAEVDLFVLVDDPLLLHFLKPKLYEGRRKKKKTFSELSHVW